MPITTVRSESCTSQELLNKIKDSLRTKTLFKLWHVPFTAEVLDNAIALLLAEGNTSSVHIPPNATPDKKMQLISLTSQLCNAALVLGLLTENNDYSLFCAHAMEKGADKRIFGALFTPINLKRKILGHAFVKKLPKAVAEMAIITSANNVCIYSPSAGKEVPLVSHAIIAGDFSMAQQACALGASLNAKDVEGYSIAHHLHWLPYNTSVADVRKFVDLIAAETELNLLAGGETPLSLAVFDNHSVLVEALVDVSKRTHKPLLPERHLSLSRLTVDSPLFPGKSGEDVALIIINYAFSWNETHATQKIDVFGLQGSYSFEKPYYYLHLAAEKCWSRVVRLAVEAHPEWLNEEGRQHPLHTAIDSVMGLDRENANARISEYLFLIWDLIRLSSDLSWKPSGCGDFYFEKPADALEKMNEIHPKDIQLHLAFVACELLANFARMREVDAEIRKQQQVDKKQESNGSGSGSTAKRRRVEKCGKDEKEDEPVEQKSVAPIPGEPAWLSETRRNKKLFSTYREHVFFGMIGHVTGNLHSACYLVCDCLVKFITLKSQGRGAHAWMYPMIFAFLDLKELIYLLDKEVKVKERERKPFDLPEPKESQSFGVAPDTQKAFLNKYISSLTTKIANRLFTTPRYRDTTGAFVPARLRGPGER